jgi:hypothetical protein
MFGGVDSKDYILSFPETEKLHQTAFCDLSEIQLLEFDVGTHIRCMQIRMADGTQSQKIGGFDLKKSIDLEGKQIVKVDLYRF